MKWFKAMNILVLSFFLTGCASVSVNYDYDTNFDFSTLKGYRWLEVPADFPANAIAIQRIKHAVDQQMQAKGFEQVSDSPDFLISMLGFKDVIRQGVVTGTAYSDYPGYRGYRGYGRSGSFERQYEVNEFEEGTLTLTIINAARSALIWEGSATTFLEPDRSTEYKEQKTKEIIARLLSGFPPAQEH
jgi:hypothetical protein